MTRQIKNVFWCMKTATRRTSFIKKISCDWQTDREKKFFSLKKISILKKKISTFFYEYSIRRTWNFLKEGCRIFRESIWHFTRTRVCDSATRTREDRTISIGIRMTNHLKATNASRWTRWSNNQPLINSLNDRWNGHGQRLFLVINRISLCYRCLYDHIWCA
jgi:hypothetical protein